MDAGSFVRAGRDELAGDSSSRCMASMPSCMPPPRPPALTLDSQCPTPKLHDLYSTGAPRTSSRCLKFATSLMMQARKGESRKGEAHAA